MSQVATTNVRHRVVQSSTSRRELPLAISKEKSEISYKKLKF